MNVSEILSRVTDPFRRLTSSRASGGLVALDVGLNGLRAIHVRRDGEQRVLDGFRIVRGINGAATQAFEAALGEVLDLRRGTEPVAVSISSSEAAIRRIELPPMNLKELRESLPWEARRHIAGLADDAVLDAQVLAPVGRDGQTLTRGPMAAVLVAFPRPLYDRLESALATFGIEPEFVDVSSLAAMNGLLDRPSTGAGPLALLELGSGFGSFSIFTSNDLILFRDLGQRATHMDQLLESQLSLEPAQLETLKLSGKLAKGESPSAAVIQRALAPITAELVEDLRSALLYLESRSSASLERVYLSGVNSSVLDRYGIAEAIGGQSGVALERWNPLQSFRIGLVDEIGLRASASELSAAAGLAARHFRGG